MDDDIYVNMSNLVPLLSRFDPKTEPIYIGRLGCVYDSIVIVCTSTSGSFLSFPNRFVSGKKDDGVQYNFDHLWALWVYLRMLAVDFCSICSQGLASVADITVSWQNKGLFCCLHAQVGVRVAFSKESQEEGGAESTGDDVPLCSGWHVLCQ